MSEVKCIGLDVHKTSISAAVLDQGGKLVMQAVFRTEAAAILGFYSRSRRHTTSNLGRRDPCRLAARPAEAVCRRRRGLQSAEECAAEERQ